MKIYIISIIVLLTCSLALAACGTGGTDNNQSNRSSAGATAAADNSGDDHKSDSADDDNNTESSQHGDNEHAKSSNAPQNDNNDTAADYSHVGDNAGSDLETDMKEENNMKRHYKEYVNARFGFEVEYPSTFEANDLPGNDDGIKVSDDTAVLAVSGSHAGLSKEDGSTFIRKAESIKPFYKKAVADAEEKGSISYKKLNKDAGWYVVSYTDGSDIHYEKSIMGDDFIAHLSIKYPADQQADYETVVKHAAETFAIR